MYLLLDIWHFIDRLMIEMMNKKELYEYEIVTDFKAIILPQFCTKLSKNVLRGLAVTMLKLKAVDEKESVEFYDKCCQAGVYRLYTVNSSL